MEKAAGGGDLKSVKVKAMDVSARFYDAQADAYLVVGRIPASKKSYAVGWHSRHCDTLVEPALFAIKKEAQRAFNRAAAHPDEKPDHDSFVKDWQEDGVNQWEETLLMPGTRKITQADARALLRRVSRDYGMPPPRLVWKKPGGASEYDPDLHEIPFSHRDNISLLHEMAHAIDEHAAASDALRPNHGPAFVWIAIELYHRYAGMNLNFMIVSAAQHHLLGDIHENQQVFTLSPLKTVSPPRLCADRQGPR